MTAQPTLDGGPAPGGGGLWRRLLDGDHINHAAWIRARAEHAFVGTCRQCGDYLIPDRPYEHAGRNDYSAACRSAECGWELCAPGGRVMKYSSKKSDQPKGQAA